MPKICSGPGKRPSRLGGVCLFIPRGGAYFRKTCTNFGVKRSNNPKRRERPAPVLAFRPRADADDRHIHPLGHKPPLPARIPPDHNAPASSDLGVVQACAPSAVRPCLVPARPWRTAESTHMPANRDARLNQRRTWGAISPAFKFHGLAATLLHQTAAFSAWAGKSGRSEKASPL